MEKLIVLDRDGVINEDSDAYIRSPAEWIAIEGSLEAIARLTHGGYEIAIATNQSGVGRKLYSLETMHAIHDKMHTAIAAAGGRIAGVFFCPHAPDDGCACRKPKPGLLREIAQRFGRPDLRGVPIVGDGLRDLTAGIALGCEPWLVLTGHGERTYRAGGLPEHTRVRANLAAVARELVRN